MLQSSGNTGVETGIYSRIVDPLKNGSYRLKKRFVGEVLGHLVARLLR